MKTRALVGTNAIAARLGSRRMLFESTNKDARGVKRRCSHVACGSTLGRIRNEKEQTRMIPTTVHMIPSAVRLADEVNVK